MASKSPAALKALKSFQTLGLCAEIAQTAVDLGWASPSKIQEEAIQLILQGEPPLATSIFLGIFIPFYSAFFLNFIHAADHN